MHHHRSLILRGQLEKEEKKEEGGKIVKESEKLASDLQFEGCLNFASLLEGSLRCKRWLLPIQSWFGDSLIRVLCIFLWFRKLMSSSLCRKYRLKSYFSWISTVCEYCLSRHRRRRQLIRSTQFYWVFTLRSLSPRSSCRLLSNYLEEVGCWSLRYEARGCSIT